MKHYDSITAWELRKMDGRKCKLQILDFKVEWEIFVDDLWNVFVRRYWATDFFLCCYTVWNSKSPDADLKRIEIEEVKTVQVQLREKKQINLDWKTMTIDGIDYILHLKS